MKRIVLAITAVLFATVTASALDKTAADNAAALIVYSKNCSGRLTADTEQTLGILMSVGAKDIAASTVEVEDTREGVGNKLFCSMVEDTFAQFISGR
jgi:hypothetical protein